MSTFTIRSSIAISIVPPVFAYTNTSTRVKDAELRDDFRYGSAVDSLHGGAQDEWGKGVVNKK